MLKLLVQFLRKAIVIPNGKFNIFLLYTVFHGDVCKYIQSAQVAMVHLVTKVLKILLMKTAVTRFFVNEIYLAQCVLPFFLKTTLKLFCGMNGKN